MLCQGPRFRVGRSQEFPRFLCPTWRSVMKRSWLFSCLLGTLAMPLLGQDFKITKLPGAAAALSSSGKEWHCQGSQKAGKQPGSLHNGPQGGAEKPGELLTTAHTEAGALAEHVSSSQ